MKKISFWATMLAMLVVCGLSVVSCSKDDEKNKSGNNGGNNGGQKEQAIDLDRYLKAYYVRGERVGNNLIVEMLIENKLGQDITNFRIGVATEYENFLIYDDLGNQYSDNVEFASATTTSSKSTYSWQGWQALTIPAGSYVAYFMTIHDFDSTNRARKISFDLKCKSPSIPTDDYNTIMFRDFDITDDRVLENGIQTNDTALVYSLIDCQRVGSVVQIDFSVTNNSAIDLGNITFTAGSAKDDLGNTYEYSSYTNVAFGDGKYKSQYTTRLKANETIYGRLRINRFDTTNKAKNVSIALGCSSDTYTLSDDRARFLTIPIKDNRTLYDGIQTPDLKLDVKFVGIEEDGNGNKIINYTLKNNTGEALENFTISYYSAIIDDISNRYDSFNTLLFSMNDSEFFDRGVKMTIPAGSAVNAAVALKNLNAKSKNVTFDLQVSCDNYEFADNLMHFVTVPVQK